MSHVQTNQNYSATLDMWMEFGEHGQVPLEQVASTFVITALPASVPAGIVTVVLIVDGKRLERTVRLVSGITPGDRRAMIAAHDDVAPF